MLIRTITPTSLFGHLDIRRLNKLASIIKERRDVDDVSGLIYYFHELQMNKAANQSEIAKLSLYFKNIGSKDLRKEDPLNSALYFTSLFSKKLSDELILAAQENINLVYFSVLKVVAQKLLRSNQWPTAEKLINLKYQNKKYGEHGDQLEAEILKFKVLALDGNFKKMVDQLPYLAKAGLPSDSQFKLSCLLNSDDGSDFLEVMRLKTEYPIKTNTKSNYNTSDYVQDGNCSRLLQCGLKGRLLSAKPPTLESFLKLAEGISTKYKSLDATVFLLATAKCSDISSITKLDSESLERLKNIYNYMRHEALIYTANNIHKVRNAFPDELVSLLLERLRKDPGGVNGRVSSAFLCWIVRNRPESYPFQVLMADYSWQVDTSVAAVALKSHGLFNVDAMKFIEFCILKDNVTIDPQTLAETIDISCDNFGTELTEEFLKHIHLRGYRLSSKFYLNFLKKKISTKSIGLPRAFECFKLISSQSLHGEFLQKYFRVGQELLDMSIKEANLDFCQKLYQSTSKFQLLQSLTRPKSFKSFIVESFEGRKFTKPFKSTINLECIDTALDCTQNSKLDQPKLNETFCSTALQSALINTDFNTAERIRTYMNNQGYRDGGLLFGRNILKQWLIRLNTK